MKATFHCGKKGSADHNDRNFDYMSCGDGHIDPDKVKNNVYQSYKNIFPFKKAELQFYQDQYTPWIKQQNMANKLGKTSRKKTARSLLNGSYTKPTEIILQIGNRKEHPEAAVFADCVQDFITSLAPYADNFHILNIAIHNDEHTPHAHIRGVWDYIDHYGNRHISQTKGLEALQIPLPNPDMEVSMRNNRKMVFDTILRKKWYDICEEHDLEIDRVPVPDHLIHLEKENYILLDMKKQIDTLEQENFTLKEELCQMELELEKIKKELEKEKNKRKENVWER